MREASANGVAVREVEFGEKAFWAYAAQDGPGRGATWQRRRDAGIILAVRDITEHRSLEKAKTAFVSDFSHELRTPLTTIQSAVGLLERARERLDPLEHRALELADQELARIRGMVEELMTLAQMDSWQYQLEVGPADLSTVIQTAIESVETKAQRFGIEVYFEDAGEHRCVCDVQKLYQVFLNLLDNAIKYSDPGDRVDVDDRGGRLVADRAHQGHGHRHPGGGSRPALRALLQGGQGPLARDRGERAGARHKQADSRDARRQHLRGERGRRGLRLRGQPPEGAALPLRQAMRCRRPAPASSCPPCAAVLLPGARTPTEEAPIAPLPPAAGRVDPGLGPGTRALSSGPGYKGSPSWTPNGDRIAFISGRLRGGQADGLGRARGAGPRRISSPRRPSGPRTIP